VRSPSTLNSRTGELVRRGHENVNYEHDLDVRISSKGGDPTSSREKHKKVLNVKMLAKTAGASAARENRRVTVTPSSEVPGRSEGGENDHPEPSGTLVG